MTKVTYYRLEFANKERQKREEILKGQKIEAIVTERQRDRERISWFSEEEKNNESNMKNEINPYQANDEYPLSL